MPVGLVSLQRWPKTPMQKLLAFCPYGLFPYHSRTRQRGPKAGFQPETFLLAYLHKSEILGIGARGQLSADNGWELRINTSTSRQLRYLAPVSAVGNPSLVNSGRLLGFCGSPFLQAGKLLGSKA